MATVAAVAAVGTLGVGIYGAYKSGKAMDEANAINKEAIRSQTEVMSRQLGIAEEQWGEYQETFQPINQLLAADALKGVEARYDERLAEANTDVEMAFAGSDATNTRNMARLGLNASDPRFADSVRKTGIDKAKAKINAANTTRQDERDRAEKLTWAKRMDAASIGKGVSSNSVSTLNAAGGSARGLITAAGNQSRMAQQQASDAGKFVAGATNLGFRVADYGQKNDWWTTPATNPPPATANPATLRGEGYGATGAEFADGYADGGVIGENKPMSVGGKKFGKYGIIDGPGNGTSDSIPASVDGGNDVKLSKGEFIIPADVVVKKGTDFFNKMIDQDHQFKRSA